VARATVSRILNGRHLSFDDLSIRSARLWGLSPDFFSRLKSSTTYGSNRKKQRRKIRPLAA